MKYLSLFLVLFLAACNSKTDATLQSKSSDGKTVVDITAHRTTAADAWTADIVVKSYNWKPGTLHVTEIYADDLNSETVKFDWQDEHHCLITFKLRDNTARHFQLLCSPEALQLGEI
ncbi:MAG: hypothetical protein U0T75_06915 [Chitinophagales bacterium]